MHRPEVTTLSTDHRRALCSRLTLIDETLCRIEAWARGRAVQSVFYREVNSLTAAQSERLLKVTAAAKAQLGLIQKTFALEPQVVNASNDVWAGCALIREQLADLESRRLRTYGPIAASLGRSLDAEIHSLAQHLDRLSGVVTQAERH